MTHKERCVKGGKVLPRPLLTGKGVWILRRGFFVVWCKNKDECHSLIISLGELVKYLFALCAVRS